MIKNSHSKHNKYIVSSFCVRYAPSGHGATPSLIRAIWWFISWTIIDFFRTLRLNKYHYGNIFGFGNQISDDFSGK